MSRARTPEQRAVVHRANRIKLRRRVVFPGRVAYPTRLFSMRQLDQAVCLVRRRGSARDQKVLVEAGFRPSRTAGAR